MAAQLALLAEAVVAIAGDLIFRVDVVGQTAERVVDLVAVVAAHVLLHHGAAERVVDDLDGRLDARGDQLPAGRIDLAGIGEDRADLVAAAVVFVAGDARAAAVGVFEPSGHIAERVVFGAGGDPAGGVALHAGRIDAGDPDRRAELGDAAVGEVVGVVPDVAVLVAQLDHLAERVVAVLLVLAERVGDPQHLAHRVVGGGGLAHLGDAGDRGRDRGLVHRRGDRDVGAVDATLDRAAGAVVALLAHCAQVVDGETHPAGGVVDELGGAVAVGGGVAAGRVERGADIRRRRHRAERDRGDVAVFRGDPAGAVVAAFADQVGRGAVLHQGVTLAAGGVVDVADHGVGAGVRREHRGDVGDAGGAGDQFGQQRRGDGRGLGVAAFQHDPAVGVVAAGADIARAVDHRGDPAGAVVNLEAAQVARVVGDRRHAVAQRAGHGRIAGDQPGLEGRVGIDRDRGRIGAHADGAAGGVVQDLDHRAVAVHGVARAAGAVVGGVGDQIGLVDHRGDVDHVLRRGGAGDQLGAQGRVELRPVRVALVHGLAAGHVVDVGDHRAGIVDGGAQLAQDGMHLVDDAVGGIVAQRRQVEVARQRGAVEQLVEHRGAEVRPDRGVVADHRDPSARVVAEFAQRAQGVERQPRAAVAVVDRVAARVERTPGQPRIELGDRGGVGEGRGIGGDDEGARSDDLAGHVEPVARHHPERIDRVDHPVGLVVVEPGDVAGRVGTAHHVVVGVVGVAGGQVQPGRVQAFGGAAAERVVFVLDRARLGGAGAFGDRDLPAQGVVGVGRAQVEARRVQRNLGQATFAVVAIAGLAATGVGDFALPALAVVAIAGGQRQAGGVFDALEQAADGVVAQFDPAPAAIDRGAEQAARVVFVGVGAAERVGAALELAVAVVDVAGVGDDTARQRGGDVDLLAVAVVRGGDDHAFRGGDRGAAVGGVVGAGGGAAQGVGDAEHAAVGVVAGADHFLAVQHGLAHAELAAEPVVGVGGGHAARIGGAGHAAERVVAPALRARDRAAHAFAARGGQAAAVVVGLDGERGGGAERAFLADALAEAVVGVAGQRVFGVAHADDLAAAVVADGPAAVAGGDIGQGGDRAGGAVAAAGAGQGDAAGIGGAVEHFAEGVVADLADLALGVGDAAGVGHAADGEGRAAAGVVEGPGLVAGRVDALDALAQRVVAVAHAVLGVQRVELGLAHARQHPRGAFAVQFADQLAEHVVAQAALAHLAGVGGDLAAQQVAHRVVAVAADRAFGVLLGDHPAGAVVADAGFAHRAGRGRGAQGRQRFVAVQAAELERIGLARALQALGVVDEFDQVTLGVERRDQVAAAVVERAAGLVAGGGGRAQVVEAAGGARRGGRGGGVGGGADAASGAIVGVFDQIAFGVQAAEFAALRIVEEAGDARGRGGAGGVGDAGLQQAVGAVVAVVGDAAFAVGLGQDAAERVVAGRAGAVVGRAGRARVFDAIVDEAAAQADAWGERGEFPVLGLVAHQGAAAGRRAWAGAGRIDLAVAAVAPQGRIDPGRIARGGGDAAERVAGEFGDRAGLVDLPRQLAFGVVEEIGARAAAVLARAQAAAAVVVVARFAHPAGGAGDRAFLDVDQAAGGVALLAAEAVVGGVAVADRAAFDDRVRQAQRVLVDPGARLDRHALLDHPLGDQPAQAVVAVQGLEAAFGAGAVRISSRPRSS